MEEDNILKEHEQSEFNAGIATLQRLDVIKKWLISVTISPDALAHYRHLKAFYKELQPMFTDDKETKEKEIQKTRWKSGKLLEQKLLKKESLDEAQGSFLDEWEMELREIEQIHGLNMPKRKDARFALSKR